MRHAGAISVTLVAILVATAIVASRYVPAIPQIAPPPAIRSDDHMLLDDDLLRPVPGYPQPLAQFDELSFWDTASGHAETYRMILMPTFDHPCLIRVSKDRDGAKLVVKFLDGKGGFNLGTIYKTEERNLTDEEWDSVLGAVDAADFWYAPSLRKDDGMPQDGASWWLQGREGGNIRSIMRRTPKNKELEMFLLFLTLSGHREEYRGYF